MKRILIISFLTAAVAALLPAVALGKGASEATIVGPGLDDPITLAGEDQPGRGADADRRVGRFFPAVFTQLRTRCSTSGRRARSGRIHGHVRHARPEQRAR